jgi:hypothetical protein
MSEEAANHQCDFGSISEDAVRCTDKAAVKFGNLWLCAKHGTRDPLAESIKASSKAAACDCWEKTNEGLKGKGFRLSGLLSSLTFSASHPLGIVRHLPLERADGSKLKRNDPQSISITHCPWCGSEYPTEEGGEG